MSEGRAELTLRRTPLHPTHVSAGARLVDFAGWEMPQQYTSVREEQHAVRTAAALFDVSHMGRFLIEGDTAGDLLQQTVTNDLAPLDDGQAIYTLMCRPDGGIIDDLVVYRGRPWRAVVNAAGRATDLDWLRDRAPQSVTITDVSDESALIALQGPDAQRHLQAITAGADLDAIPFFGWTEATVAGVPTVLSRTGYTGEDGFELWVPAARAPQVWQALANSATPATPAGLATRDVCRLEAGLRLYGTDMDRDTTPYQAGLGWTVKLDKGEFVGRDALDAQKRTGPDRRLVGIETEGRAIPRHGAAVRVPDAAPQVGAVTSGTYSFWLQKGIGLASIEVDHAARDTRLAIDARGAAAEARIVGLPFYKGSARSTGRPPRRGASPTQEERR
jgi:aminomethyltransferase